MSGNERFVARKLKFFEEDLAILQKNTVEKQEPFASVLSCADSRVPVELLFDQSIGHIRPAVDAARGDFVGAIKANARIQAKLLRESSPVVADALKTGSLQVVAAYYDLATGKVTLLD